EVAEDQRLRVGRNDLGRAAGTLDEGREPLGRARDVAVALGICTDAWECKERGELVEPGLGHGAGVYAARAASWPQAASMSRPRVSRTVAGMRARSSTALKAAIALRAEPSKAPVGL